MPALDSPWVLLLLALFTLDALVLLFGYLVYRKMSRTQYGGGMHADNRPDDFKVLGRDRESFDTRPFLMPTYEPVRFPSRGGDSELSGWYVPGNGQAAVVLAHGLNGWKGHHEALLPAGMLAKAGFDVLVFDLRAHGESDRAGPAVSTGMF